MSGKNSEKEEKLLLTPMPPPRASTEAKFDDDAEKAMYMKNYIAQARGTAEEREARYAKNREGITHDPLAAVPKIVNPFTEEALRRLNAARGTPEEIEDRYRKHPGQKEDSSRDSKMDDGPAVGR